MATDWTSLGERLNVTPAGGGEPDRPSDAALDQFESTHGVTLPGDYRAFVKTFGPGELSAIARIYAPVGRGHAGDLGTFVDGFRKGAGVLSKAFGDAKFIKRAIPFANTVFGDMIVWDPEKPTDQASHDYQIFLLTKEDSKIVPLAPDFATFINDRCLSSQFGEYLDYPDYEPEATFVAFAAMGAK